MASDEPNPALRTEGGPVPGDLPPRPAPSPASRPGPRPRTLVIELVHYIAPGEAPVSWESKYNRFTDADDGPYHRKQRVGPGWEPLDAGWLPEPGTLLLANPAPRWERQPTPEERERAEGAVVLVGTRYTDGEGTAYTFPFASVRPGESSRFEPADVKQLYVCTVVGEVRLSVTALPG